MKFEHSLLALSATCLLAACGLGDGNDPAIDSPGHPESTQSIRRNKADNILNVKLETHKQKNGKAPKTSEMRTAVLGQDPVEMAKLIRDHRELLKENPLFSDSAADKAYSDLVGACQNNAKCMAELEQPGSSGKTPGSPGGSNNSQKPGGNQPGGNQPGGTPIPGTVPDSLKPFCRPGEYVCFSRLPTVPALPAVPGGLANPWPSDVPQELKDMLTNGGLAPGGLAGLTNGQKGDLMSDPVGSDRVYAWVPRSGGGAASFAGAISESDHKLHLRGAEFASGHMDDRAKLVESAATPGRATYVGEVSLLNHRDGSYGVLKGDLLYAVDLSLFKGAGVIAGLQIPDASGAPRNVGEIVLEPADFDKVAAGSLPGLSNQNVAGQVIGATGQATIEGSSYPYSVTLSNDKDLAGVVAGPTNPILMYGKQM